MDLSGNRMIKEGSIVFESIRSGVCLIQAGFSVRRVTTAFINKSADPFRIHPQ